ncbi:hypothetical protein [Cupriavidus gilardii]|uniref:Uncharacterized protein n=1 Tax=Cupriavidus gilardii TaxID=82541 RepID=A0A849BK45_9BURK|nr:hypothetical protein [Cupriavidus gilardii]NNH13955.1 hypothetical protein [Cupriavidus gilardii]
MTTKNRNDDTFEDEHDEPEAEYHDESTPCRHGVAPAWDCDWCADEREE